MSGDMNQRIFWALVIFQTPNTSTYDSSGPIINYNTSSSPFVSSVGFVVGFNPNNMDYGGLVGSQIKHCILFCHDPSLTFVLQDDCNVSRHNSQS